MAGVGRGAILRKMMDNTKLGEKEAKSGCLAAFGRGTSLMTPSQFMKNSLKTAKKTPSTYLDQRRVGGVDIFSEPDIEENNQKIEKLTLQEDDAEKETIYEEKLISSVEENSPAFGETTNLIIKDEKIDPKTCNKSTNIIPNLHTDFEKTNKLLDGKKTGDSVSLKSSLDVASEDFFSIPESNTPTLRENTNLILKDEKIDLKTSNKSTNITPNLDTDIEKTYKLPDMMKTEDVALLDSSSDVPSEDFFSIPEQISNYLLDDELVNHKEGKVKDNLQKVDLNKKTIERGEDEKWKFYQVERKINKIIKSITLQNLGEMFEELECLVEERPLSSRYMNCSEVQMLLEALMKNAVENAEFLPLAPCLIKMVSEHQPIEFKQYFPEIVDGKCQESVTLSASDEYLNKSGQQFCKVLGHLFAMPRQTGPTLFNIISLIVGEYVEQWTLPEGSEVESDGLQAYKLAIDASAVRCLLLEITNKMLACDREVETEMEKYVWFMRESVLNAAVPKKVREIYLDGLIEIQTTSSDGSTVSASAYGLLNGTNSQEESDADIYFESDPCIEDEQYKAKNNFVNDLSITKADEEKSEMKAPRYSNKNEDDKFDFDSLENPRLDTIAMAPRIENVYDSSAMVPKPSTNRSGGFSKMAMTFDHPPVSKKKSNVENDADIIIEDEGNGLSDQINTEVIDVDAICNDDDDISKENSIKVATNSIFVPFNNVDRGANSNPFVPCTLPNKKLPLGRGRGLARLPDFSANNSFEKPIANVNPIGYSTREWTNNKNHDTENIYSPREETIGQDRELKYHSSHNVDGSNNDTSRYKTHGQFTAMSRNNDSRAEKFNHHRVGFDSDPKLNSFQRRRGGGSYYNEARTNTFQNNRGGGFSNRGNHNRNNFNSPQNDLSWRNKNAKFRGENQKQRKTNFRPVYHKKSINSADDQYKTVDVALGPPKPLMEKFYHSNGRLEYRAKTPEKREFGSIMPRTCLRCNSVNHVAEECTENNLFF